MTYFIQEMLKEGFLVSNRFYANYAHTDIHVDQYFFSLKKVFKCISDISKVENIETYLYGDVARPGFGRLT